MILLVRSESRRPDEDAGQLLRVEDRVVAAVLDPRAVLHAHDVAGRVVRDGEPGEGKKPVWRKIKLLWDFLH
jgi:hypothetical protein